MKLVLTWKLIGESKGDAMDMPKAVPLVQELAQKMTQEGTFGDPENVEHRFLVVPGTWDRG